MLVFKGQNSPLLAEGWFLQVFKDRNRKKLGENGHSRIASRTFTKIPISAISSDFYGAFFELFLVDLGLIDAEDVGYVLLDELVENLLVEDAADAVHIPHSDSYPLVGFACPKDTAIGLLLLEVAFTIAYLIVEFAGPHLLYGLAHWTCSSPRMAATFLGNAYFYRNGNMAAVDSTSFPLRPIAHIAATDHINR
jgi:hypothetical protein